MLAPQEIMQRVSDRLQLLLPDAAIADVGPDRSLKEFAAFDSVAVLELVVWLESEFGISVDDGEVTPDRFDSVEKIREYVEQQMLSPR